MKNWLSLAFISVVVAASCAKATDEELLGGGDEGSGGSSGASGTSPFGGAAGRGGTSPSGGGSARGGTASGGTSNTGGAGQGGAVTGGMSGTSGTSGSDSGGASDGGEGGTDICVLTEPAPDLRVDYKEGARPVTDDPGGEFQLRNATDDETIPLTELTIRYWFTSEFTCEQTADEFVVNIADFRLQNPHVARAQADVTTRVVTLDTGAAIGCDAYFEIGFEASAGELEPDQYAAVIYYAQIPIYTRTHNQANDYSYGACTRMAVYFERVTVYRNGRLVAGREPGGGGGGEGGAGGESSGGMGGI